MIAEVSDVCSGKRHAQLPPKNRDPGRDFATTGLAEWIKMRLRTELGSRRGKSVNDRWRNLWRRVARWFGRRTPVPDAADVDADLLDIDLRTHPATSPNETLPPYVDVPLEIDAPAPRIKVPVAPAPPMATFVSDTPVSGDYIASSFSNASGTRPYKLYLPGGAHARPMPLVVMLHGCRQDPDDFAAGTRMNQLADAAGWVVLYPGQDRRFNHLGCWNWFQETDQRRGKGEPSIIADLTRHMIAAHSIDPRRVYIAGLSAGGAMAAIMASTYPELFAAAGIHSGLPHAAAKDLASALHAMKHGPALRDDALTDERRNVPTIVFHGDQDTTVHPCNGDELIARTRWAANSRVLDTDDDLLPSALNTEHGQVLGGHAFSRTIHRDAQGRPDAEHWVIHGLGHAWSGGSPSGSFTDPLGPDASREMLRFFLQHPQTQSVGIAH